MAVSLPAGSLDPRTYQPHALHHEQRTFAESNCYVDLWIEVLHSLGLDPHPCLPFTLCTDFEGDQWTFFKPPLDDLWQLYGIEVQELSVWRPLVDQVAEQVARGRLVLPEVDAFFLPDTQGTDYRRQHSKTTIAIRELDVAGAHLGYFHNGGYFHLGGADFAGLFRLGAPAQAALLPPYVEVVKLDGLKRFTEPELLQKSLVLMRTHLLRLPPPNPLRRFRERFDEHLTWLLSDAAAFHPYAFVTLRQLGASCELAASLVKWLTAHGETDLSPAYAEYTALAGAAKALLLKTARAANHKKSVDAAPLLEQMAASWTTATDCLLSRYGSCGAAGTH